MAAADLRLESIPIVDLRLLTQSELYSLSLTSTNSFSSSSSNRFDDDVLIPKIDRSVFNESAGSRKQTYSRLRLAPRNTTASNSSSALLPSHPLGDDVESRRIVSLLKQLFPSDSQNDGASFVRYKSGAASPPPPSSSALRRASDVFASSQSKRGRRPKNSAAVPVNSAALTFEAEEDGDGGASTPKREGEARPVATFVLNSEGQLVLSNEVRLVQSNEAKLVLNNEGKLVQNDEGNLVQNNEAKLVQKNLHNVQSNEAKLGQNDEGKLVQSNEGKLVQNNEAKLAQNNVHNVQNNEAKLVQNNEGKIVQNDEGNLVQNNEAKLVQNNVHNVQNNEAKLVQNNEGKLVQNDEGNLVQNDEGNIVQNNVQNVQNNSSEGGGGKRKRGRPRKDDPYRYRKVEEPSLAVKKPKVKKEVVVEGEMVMVNGNDVVVDLDLQNVQNNSSEGGGGKRKRGRPRKDDPYRYRKVEEPSLAVKKPKVKKEVVVEGEMVMVNGNDVVVDLDLLGNGDIVFGEELRKRTEGLESEAQLLGFLEGLQGDWSSARKKRKIVQASELGDLLPKWWKILLALKRNGGQKWLVCKQYISPNGQQFVSCKEVSSYLHSYFGPGNQPDPVHTDGNIQVSNKVVFGDEMQQDTDLVYGTNNNVHELVGCSLVPDTSVKCHVKGIETSKEVSKKFDPVRKESLGASLNIQDSVGIDREQISHTIADHDLSSSFSQEMVSDIMEKCFGTYNDELISLSCEEQAMNADKDCFSDGLKDCVKGTISSVDVLKVDVESASNGKGKEHGADNIDNHQLTSTIDDMNIDGVDNCGNDMLRSGIGKSHIGSENVYTSVDQQSTSQACSLVPSIIMESRQERGSESGLNSKSTDEKTRAVSNNHSNDSFPTFYDPPFDVIGLSGSNDKTNSFGADHALPYDSMEISGRIRSTGSCSGAPPLDGQSCTTVNNATNPRCMMEELWQEKKFSTNAFTSFVNKQSLDVNKGRIHTVERPKVDHAKNYNNSELSVNFGSRDTGTSADTTSCIEQEIGSKGYSYAPHVNEHVSVIENNVVCGSVMDKVNQNRGTSETALVSSSGYRQGYNMVNNVNTTTSRSMEESREAGNRSWDNEVLLAFGSCRDGLEANSVTDTAKEIGSQGPSRVISEYDQTYSTGSGNFSRSILDDELIRGSGNGLERSGSEQISGFVNNLNRVYSSSLWEQPKSMGAEKSRNNEHITSFFNNSQPTGDAMSEHLWRIGEQNIYQSGLANTSAALRQSSGNYSNLAMLPGKLEIGTSSVYEKFDNTPGLEGLKSNRTEQLEYDLLSAQASSQSRETNALSYNGRIEQDFNSFGWAEKQVLPSMPNIASRSETSRCIWCRNEFYHDDYKARMQTGSVGSICANCQGKLSGHVSFR